MSDDDSPMDFYCMICNSQFKSPLFDVSRAMEKVHFYSGGRLPEVEVTQAEGIGNYCSTPCRTSGLPSLMAVERVPFPASQPGIGPIEVCARCNGPVDMSTFHLTYTESEVVFSGFIGHPGNVDCLAVVFNDCLVAETSTAAELTVEA